jgi:hypothetical protein
MKVLILKLGATSDVVWTTPLISRVFLGGTRESIRFQYDLAMERFLKNCAASKVSLQGL